MKLYLSSMDMLLFLPLYFEIANGFFFSKTKEITCPEVGSYKFTDASPYDDMPLPECFAPLFTFFNRETTYEYSKGINFTVANIPSGYSPNKQTIILAHGYRDFPLKRNKWMVETTKNILDNFDFNVIFLNWHAHSPTYYPQAAANSRVAGRGLYDLMRILYNKGLVNDKAYCVGHSLGAHICGYAGQYLGNLKFGRITGLDPAGPEFKKLPPSARLSKEDAGFVDIIHTNGDTTFLIGYFVDYGFADPLGHVDFYPNGGKKQPGCSNKRRLSRSIDTLLDSGNKEILGELVDLLKRLLEKEESKDIREKWKKYLEDADDDDLQALFRIAKGDLPQLLGCSHRRSTDYYYKSITSPCATSNDCTSLGPNDISPSCPVCDSSCPRMGYHAADNRSKRGLYYVQVTQNSPYCQP